jgi:hypothetical protein
MKRILSIIWNALGLPGVVTAAFILLLFFYYEILKMINVI